MSPTNAPKAGLPRSAERVRGTWLSLGSQIGSALLAVFLQMFLARALGAGGFGVYATVLAWTGPLAILAGLGLPAAAVRFLPAFAAQGDAARLTAFVRTAERAVLAGAVGLALVGSAAALVVAREPGPLLVGLWTLPLSVQVTLRTEIARASGRYRAAFFLPLLQPLTMLVAALVATKIAGPLTPTIGLGLPALGALVVLAWQRARTRETSACSKRQKDAPPRGRPFAILRMRRAPALRRATFAPDRLEMKPDHSPKALRCETRAWLRVGLGVLAVDAAHLLLSQADALLVGAMRGPRAVALLSVAGAVASFSMFPMIAVGATEVPAFSGLWALGRRAALERLAQRAVRRAFLAQVVLAVILLAIARPVLALYGADFEEARLPLLFVLAGQLANTGTGYVGSLMTMTGHQAAVGRTIWLAAAINVALVITGAHLFGVTGAAAGTALSSLGWNVWLHHLVVRHVGVRVSFLDALLATRRAACVEPLHEDRESVPA